MSDVTPMTNNAAVRKSLSDKIISLVGIIGSLVTIALTIWNTHTKNLIDQREEQLKLLEIKLKDRVTGVEESKERVDRYKWVLSLFPDLDNKDGRKKNFTVSLIRLALTRDEAEQLFAGLQTSSDTSLQTLGQNGIAAIQIEPIAQLVSQMNDNTANVRKRAVAELERNYASSPQAISLVTALFDVGKINTLSASGIINALYFLSATDPTAWSQQQIAAGEKIVNRVEEKSPGPQTIAALNSFKSLLQKARQRL